MAERMGTRAQEWSAEGYARNARFVAELLPFVAEFDAVFSNAALHWMRDPDAVIAGVRRALRPGGRFVARWARTEILPRSLPGFSQRFARVA